MDELTQSVAPTTEASVLAVEPAQPTPETAQAAPVTSDQQSAQPEWKPNFKVKAYDKEYDIPENYRSFINKENEEEFRKLFSKAFAVEEMTEKNRKYLEKYDTLNKDHTTLNKAINRLETFLNNGDYDSFFSTLKVKEEALMKWMHDKLSLKSLPPEQQELYTKKSEYQKQLYDHAEQLEYYKSQFEEMKSAQEQTKIQNGLQELDAAISKPEVEAIAKSFDARLGQEGAFRDEVLQRAAFLEQRTGKTLSIDEAIQNVLKVISVAPQTSAVATITSPPQAEKKPTLPTLAGKTTSPAAQKITSVEDLKRLRSQVIANQVP
jgi:hypothetical protein